MGIIAKCDNCGKEESGIVEFPKQAGFDLGLPLGWIARGLPQHLKTQHPTALPIAVVCSIECGREYDKKHGIETLIGQIHSDA